MKKLSLFLLAFLTFGMPRVAEAQVTVAPFLTSNPQFLDGSGSPLNSGCVFTYAAGTTTPLVTYSDSAGSTPNSNPVLLNSGGFPQAGGIWLTAAAYKFVVKTTGGSNCSTGSTITTTDGITWSTPLSTFSGITSTGNAVIQPATAATGGANQSSPTLCIQGFYFNVTSLTDQWCLSDVLGTGTAPTSTFTVSHSGSGGVSTILFPGNVSVGAALGVTGLFDSHFIFADLQSGADFCAKVNTAVGMATTGDVIDAAGFTTDQTLSTVCAISKSVKLLLPPVTLTCAMSDPGTASGCFNITADAVTIDGVPGGTVITQANSALIQTAIFFGNHKNFTIRGVKLNWNEAHEAKTTQFYTGIRSSGGSADIQIYNNEFTACGDRCIDIRGATRIWIGTSGKNYLHQTGINVGGTGLNGSAISVSVDGTTTSNDCWIQNNQIEEWGDTALSCDHGARAHIIGNTVRGRADFGNAPSGIESALDIVGSTDVEVTGNHVLNVFLFGLDSESQTVGGVTYVPSNVRIIGNEFKHSLSSTVDPLVNFGTALATGQIRNVTIEGNTFENTRLAVGDIDGVSVTGNSFKDISTQVFTNAIQLQESTGVLADFHVEGNNFTTTNASMATAILVRNTVLTPGASTVGPNVVQSGIVPIVNSGAALQQSTQDNSQLYRRSADTTAAILDLFKARGTPASAAVVQSGDLLGQVNLWGFDGTNYIKSGMIQQNAQGAPSAGVVPSRMKFFAMNGSGSLVNLFILLGDAGQLEVLGDVFPDADGTRGIGLSNLRFNGHWKASTVDGTNGETWVRGSNSELLTLSTVGTTTDTAGNLLPANSIIEAVVARVTTTITTATDWKLGDATQAARFTPAIAILTAGTTTVGLNQADPTVASANLGPVQTSAAKVRVTTTGTPGAGVIRITVFYRQFVPPTS